MWTRRSFLAASPLLASPASGEPVALEWSHLPAAARRIAPDLGLTAETWEQWRFAQRDRLRRRIDEGTAEHLTYYFLQSRAFTDLPPLDPTGLARSWPEALPAEARARAEAFLESNVADARHGLLRELQREQAWPLERCYRHTMAFLKAKEIERQPLEPLYYRRGLSSDTAPSSTQVLDAIPDSPRTVLLVGPGLDLTRRERFDDQAPLVSHQLEFLRRRLPGKAIDLVDVRPEVVRQLNAGRVDVVTESPRGSYDLIIATNLLLYFDSREMFTAMAALARALAPGGRLLHNDQRFAAKVFGECLGLTLERFEPMQFAARRGVEQWDRAVIHRKEDKS